ncbi:archaetidylserine decarboxylase [Pirellulaceae bacterium SH449]
MDEIHFFDRYSRTIKTEKVYGDRALRWIYSTVLGRISLNLLVKRAIFSRWYGWKMDHASSREKIGPFIEQFELDPDEFAEEWRDFKSFNEFFYRRLKPDARPIDRDPNSIVFPADGRHLCIPDLSHTDGLFVKGQMFRLEELLGSTELANRYSRGSLLLSRLCPVDYHRFHFPAEGQVGESRLIKGPLFSVNPIALRQNIRILATNKRSITELESERFGKVLLIEVGATCVGSICQTYRAGTTARKGDEKGYFKFGGSSTITIFEPGVMRFDDDLIEHSAQLREVFGRMGDRIGSK